MNQYQYNMKRIETTQDKIYIKGEKSGSATVTLTFDNPISVKVNSYSNNLKGNVDVVIDGNETNAVIVTISYEDLYLNGETYSGKIIATTSTDSLSIPVIINCSDTLIYTTMEEFGGSLRLTYDSLPEVNKVTLVGSTTTDISNRLVGSYPNPRTIYIPTDERHDNRYVIAENGLSQISNEIGTNESYTDSVYTFKGVYEFYSGVKEICVLQTGHIQAVVDQMHGVDGFTSLTINGANSNHEVGNITGSSYYYALSPVMGDSVAVEFKYNRMRDYTFYKVKSLLAVTELENVDIGSVGLFYGCDRLQNISGLRNLKVINSTENMFSGCRYLLDLSPIADWDVSNVTNLSGMFSGTSVYSGGKVSDSERSLGALSNWDISNATDLSGMFNGCVLNNLDALSNWVTSNVTDLSAMFSNTNLKDINGISNWDTSNVISLANLFHYCIYLTDASPLSNWVTSNVTTMNQMFYNCELLHTIPLLNAQNVTGWNGLNYTFWGCTSLENFGGLAGVKTSFDLSDSPLLTYESLKNVINNLAVVSDVQTLKLHWDSVDKLTNGEIAIAANKGWVITYDLP